MALYYFDTSALVKRYVDEPGSTWARYICDARDGKNQRLNLVVVGSITVVEIAAAVSILERRNIIRKRTAQRAYDQFYEHFESEYQVADLTSDLLLTAAELARQYPLKAYDAVQLGLALVAKSTLQTDQLDLVFVSGDRQLLQAAQGEGLAVENPFSHADLDPSPSGSSNP